MIPVIKRPLNTGIGFTQPYFKTYRKAAAKTVWYWYKGTDQWNRIENSEIKTFSVSLFSTKVPTKWEK